MKIGVLGTGIVGQVIATKLVALGHEVCMGSRTADNQAAREWADANGTRAANGTFSDAAAMGEVVFNCTSGGASLVALESAGGDNLVGKVLIDLANPLDFSGGMPPTLSVVNDSSLAEKIQEAFPQARVVKTLNTLNCQIMVEPSLLPGPHEIFVSGNDAAAKNTACELLYSFGWTPEQVIDLGDITTARGTEMYLPLWLRLFGAGGTPNFNVHIVRAEA